VKHGWTGPAVAGLLALAASAPAAEPLMAQGTVTITELNYFSLFNTSAYSLTMGAIEIRADKRGQPCAGFASGQTADARYSAKEIILTREKQECKLTVRRMEFTDAPGTH
jgi:hypothetical protein